MKHLNPRQGITTPSGTRGRLYRAFRFRCETPKSPPGDYNRRAQRNAAEVGDIVGVKHLNPRQGITTSKRATDDFLPLLLSWSVKHLNPRQGITTFEVTVRCVAAAVTCETPKSPPGDYNLSLIVLLLTPSEHIV